MTALLLLLLAQAPQDDIADPRPDLPPLHSLVRFPADAVIDEQHARCMAWHDWYAEHARLRPEHRQQIWQTMWSLREQARLWELLREARDRARGVEARREALADLRRFLRRDAWLMGRMPDLLPGLPDELPLES